MASVPDRNSPMLELLRLEEYILTQVDLGQSEFKATELANETASTSRSLRGDSVLGVDGRFLRSLMKLF